MGDPEAEMKVVDTPTSSYVLKIPRGYIVECHKGDALFLDRTDADNYAVKYHGNVFPLGKIIYEYD